MSTKPILLIDNLKDGRTRRHYVAATVTQEGEWNQHEPNNGLARMFVVMLLLHVFVIGGIILYDFIGEEQTIQQQPASTAAKPKAAAGAAQAAPPQVATATAPAAIDPMTYQVRSGDSLPLIIARLGVDKDEFIKLNNLEQDGQIAPGTVLRVPAGKATAPPQQVEAAQSLTAMHAAPQRDSGVSASDRPPEPVESPSNDPAAAGRPPGSKTTLVPLPAGPDASPATAPVTSLSTASTEQSKPKATPKTNTVAQPPRPVPSPSEMAKRPLARADQPPKTAPKKPAAADTPPKTASKSGGSTHTLAKGETLYRLSMKYGVSVDALIKANNIKDPGKLRDGTKLVIPAR